MIAEHRNIAVREPDFPATARQTHPGTFIDLERAEMAVKNLLIALGEDPDRESLAGTIGHVGRTRHDQGKRRGPG